MLNKEDLIKTFQNIFKSTLDFKKYESVFDKINKELAISTEEVRSLEEKINSQIQANFLFIDNKIHEYKLKTKDIFKEVSEKQAEFSQKLMHKETEMEKFVDSANFRLVNKKNILREENKKNNLEFDEQIISFTDKKLKDENIILKSAKDQTKLTDQNLKLRLNFINSNFETKSKNLQALYPATSEKTNFEQINEQPDDKIWFKTLVNFYNAKVKKINQEKEQSIKTIDAFFNEKIVKQQKIIETIESNYANILKETELEFQGKLTKPTLELVNLAELKKTELKSFEKVYFSDLNSVYIEEYPESIQNQKIVKIKDTYNKQIAQYLKNFSQKVAAINEKITKIKEQAAETKAKIEQKRDASVFKNKIAIQKLVETKLRYLDEIKSYFQKTLDTFDRYLFISREFFNLNVLINKNKIAKANFIQNSIHQNQEINFNHLKEVLNIKQDNLNQEKENLVFSAFSDTNLIKQEINVAKELRLTHLNYYHSSLLNNLILKKSENEKTHLQKLNTIDLSFNLYFLNSFLKKETENAKLFFSTTENSFVKLIEIVEDFFTIFNKNDMSKILNFDFVLNYANSLNKHNYNIAMLLKAVISEIEQDFFVKEQISDFELFEFNSYIAETMSLVLSFQFKRTLDIVNLQAEKILNKVIQEAENWLLEIKQNQLKVVTMLKANQKEYEATLKQIVATVNVDEISFQSTKEFFKAIKKVQANAELKIKTNTTYFTENIISRLAELKKMKSSDFFDAFYFSDHFKNLSDQYFRKTMHTTSVQAKAVRNFQTKFTDEFKNLKKWFQEHRDKIVKKQHSYLDLIANLKTEVALALSTAHDEFLEEIKAEKRDLTYLKKQKAKHQRNKISREFLRKQNNLKQKIKVSIATLKQEPYEKKRLEQLVFLNKVQTRMKISAQKEVIKVNYLKKLKQENNSFKVKLTELEQQKRAYLNEVNSENQSTLLKYLKNFKDTKKYIIKMKGSLS